VAILLADFFNSPVAVFHADYHFFELLLSSIHISSIYKQLQLLLRQTNIFCMLFSRPLSAAQSAHFRRGHVKQLNGNSASPYFTGIYDSTAADY
jgi:hypothetical protein